VATARSLDPKLGPAYPEPISALARHVGYEAAEGIANLGRAPRDFVRRILRRLRPAQEQRVFEWN
jgi:hypothetical protein